MFIPFLLIVLLGHWVLIPASRATARKVVMRGERVAYDFVSIAMAAGVKFFAKAALKAGRSAVSAR